MNILIDGYNLIKQALNINYVPPDDKFKFLNRLNKYAQKRGHQITVVFDGYDDDLKFSSSRVKIVFSGYNKSADDLIMEIAGNFKGDVLLVSSDRELCNFVEEDSKLEYMDSLEFYSFLKKSEREDSGEVVQEQTVKMTDSNNAELDKLMQQDFGLEIKSEDVDICYSEPTRHKQSKNEKRILKKIEKL